jgi:hypothetical protein
MSSTATPTQTFRDSRDLVPAADLQALVQLSAEYWTRADGVRPLDVGELFMDEGVLLLGSLRLAGRSAIDTFFREREASMRATQRVTRHFAANTIATVAGPGRAFVRSTVLVFSGEGALPLPAAAPSGVADFEDLCVHDPARGWRFEERVGRTIFIGAGAPSFAR